MPLDIDAIKHYKILERLGKGGMGEVYLAQDLVLNRKVAIKVLLEELERDPHARMRFLREAKAAAALDHPFICKVYETGEYDDKAYIVMEFIEGETLAERLEEEPLSMRESFAIAIEIAEALEKAHASGFIHRDLKPANIMLTPQGHVKVMDFGLAKKFDIAETDDIDQTLQTITQQATLTEEGAIAGTLAYMSPEQAKGSKEIDSRSDIFAFGLILYEMSTGRHPFMKASGIETLSAILKDSAPPTQAKPKSVNPILSPILRKCLAKAPEHRYRETSELVADLNKAQRTLIGGKQVVSRGLPILAAAAVIVVAAVFIITRFTRPAKVVLPEKPEPQWVLITDFQNTTGDSVFDGSLEDAMRIGIEGASFITGFKRSDARNIAKELKPDFDGRLDVQTAQLVCMREGISLLVDGGIQKTESEYVLYASVRDPTDEASIKEYSRRVSNKAEVLSATVWLANKIREDLGDIAADAAQVFAQETFSTSSLEAMHAYTRAQDLYGQGNRDEAIAEYLRAIEEDPDFGRAYSGLALVYRNIGQPDLAEKYFQEALSRIDRMSDREKFRTRGIYHLINRNFQGAIEECSQLVEKFPGDFAGYTNLALAYFYARDYAKAEEIGIKAVELYPANILPHFNLSWYALVAGNYELSEQEVQKALEIDPEYDETLVVLALSKLARENTQSAIETYNQLKSISPEGASLAALGLADVALYEGRITDAIDILQKRLDFDKTTNRTEYLSVKRIMLAQALCSQNQNTEALKMVTQALEASRGTDTLFPAAQIYITCGREKEALALAQQLKQRLASEPQTYGTLIEGEISLKQGKNREAIDVFKAAQALLDTWLGRFALGRAYLAAELFPEAHAEFDACLRRKGEATSVFFNDAPSFSYLPPVYYYLGRAQEGLGSSGSAASYQKFLSIKANADKGHPFLEDSKTRLTRMNQ